ncbi:MAG: FAD-binding oxidoreductase [Solirubrobacterales bacterium]|nr:FAD-binding oxidoreductase [Solirubrobacterales bacterium]
MTERRQAALPARADVVIIGGGVMGTSAAFHLAEAGAEVLLLERGALASGSTSRAAGGVRSSFSDALNVRIARRSIEAFRDFGSRPGWEIDLRQVGYLFLLTREADVNAFQASVTQQRALGAPAEIITPAQAREICPLIEVGDVLAASFCAEDGHATPEAVVQGYAFGARPLGARIITGCEVTGIATKGNRIAAVRTPRGEVLTEAVVCAAGAWSRSCGEMVGLELPVTPLRRQILFTEPMPDLPAELPMTIDFETGFYFHREGPGLLMGMADVDEEPGFSLETTDDWIPGLLAVAERRAPRVATAGIRGGWAGLYEMTPDHNAIIGEAPSPARFIYATGFSGHGFLQGPAVGEIIRDLVLEREPFVDIEPFSVERFRRARSRPELNIV